MLSFGTTPVFHDDHAHLNTVFHVIQQYNFILTYKTRWYRAWVSSFGKQNIDTYTRTSVPVRYTKENEVQVEYRIRISKNSWRGLIVDEKILAARMKAGRGTEQ